MGMYVIWAWLTTLYSYQPEYSLSYILLELFALLELYWQREAGSPQVVSSEFAACTCWGTSVKR